MSDETKINFERHALIIFDVQHSGVSLDKQAILARELSAIESCFPGKTYNAASENFAELIKTLQCRDSIVFFCGDAENFLQRYQSFKGRLTIVKELSCNYDRDNKLISLGELPINIHDSGLYFRQLLTCSENKSHYDDVLAAHRFQILSESNKPGSSYRKGIYLSDVKHDNMDGMDRYGFNLLRCSTNFQGPTLNFADIDRSIIDKVNQIASSYFERAAPLNHVLAQLYQNSTLEVNDVAKEKKAKIKRHADKTKDMPDNGLIAFCTFYSNDLDLLAKPSRQSWFDHCYKDTSVLTRLRFRLKDSVIDRPDLKSDFSIDLYPGSVFLIPLSTNRLYCHEIVPSHLPVDKIPTRLGYVIRCSKTRAVHIDGQTYILEKSGDDGDIKLQKPSERDREDLKALYFKENTSHDRIQYPQFYFSVNDGDYQQPKF